MHIGDRHQRVMTICLLGYLLPVEHFVHSLDTTHYQTALTSLSILVYLFVVAPSTTQSPIHIFQSLLMHGSFLIATHSSDTHTYTWHKNMSCLHTYVYFGTHCIIRASFCSTNERAEAAAATAFTTASKAKFVVVKSGFSLLLILDEGRSKILHIAYLYTIYLLLIYLSIANVLYLVVWHYCISGMTSLKLSSLPYSHI